MLSGTIAAKQESLVLLASQDSLLISELQRIFSSLGLRIETVPDGEAAIAAMNSSQDSSIVLLDVRVADGRLLAAMQESGVHQRCAIALIAEEVSEEWLARMREGGIDDIVPHDSNAAAWAMHLSTMRRGHELYRELMHLREASLAEMQHDRVTDTLNRETMLTLLFRETDRVQRQRGALCLVLFDIDDFGHWNRELGRDVCDVLLREVAVRTARILRSYDLLGRVGKDEFLLALPGCSTIHAMMLAERMRIDVFGEPFSVLDMGAGGQKEIIQLRLTACFAIASSHGRSPLVVLRHAEQTLAWTKGFGPDSVRCASESPLSAENSVSLARLFPEAGVLA
jgi:two-component system, cell cycle response regulator